MSRKKSQERLDVRSNFDSLMFLSFYRHNMALLHVLQVGDFDNNTVQTYWLFKTQVN